jgi:hypothetical protein
MMFKAGRASAGLRRPRLWPRDGRVRGSLNRQSATPVRPTQTAQSLTARGRPGGVRIKRRPILGGLNQRLQQYPTDIGDTEALAVELNLSR